MINIWAPFRFESSTPSLDTDMVIGFGVGLAVGGLVDDFVTEEENKDKTEWFFLFVIFYYDIVQNV